MSVVAWASMFTRVFILSHRKRDKARGVRQASNGASGLQT